MFFTYYLLHRHPLHFDAIDVQLSSCWSIVVAPHLDSLIELFNQYCDHISDRTMSRLALTRLIDDLIGFHNDDSQGFKRHKSKHNNNKYKQKNRRKKRNHNNKNKNEDECEGHIHIRDIYRYIMWRCSIKSNGILHEDTFIDIFIRLLCDIPLLHPHSDLNSIIQRSNQMDELPLTYNTPRENLLHRCISANSMDPHAWSVEIRLRLLLAALFGAPLIELTRNKFEQKHHIQIHDENHEITKFERNVLGSYRIKKNVSPYQIK